MKLSVVYYSLEGNIRYVAQKLADALGANLLELVPVKEYPMSDEVKTDELN